MGRRAANQFEGMADQGGKGLSVIDVMTAAHMVKHVKYTRYRT